ncbi:heavy-metal-associated domain-containing protein [Nodosilinea sp. LEGE 07298]|uniref:heavy-metal-associated domain-containing protein n=1 Tax=Nodosilinea sp. LEGE 07298 TaxID=2777970 RepID=UPI0018816F5E|nr:heavy metal-associated domain-containing protein [Nodosilinea sp. LEGE 07298]MBE9108212.1 heavy-metal-associated domain-containing protein [Nodosilinea sp. LEGE 07298]
MHISTLEIEGMMCSGCGEIIERAAEKIPGIEKCTVEFSKSQATVVYDPQLVTMETVQRALAGAGYSTQVVENSSVA